VIVTVGGNRNDMSCGAMLPRGHTALHTATLASSVAYAVLNDEPCAAGISVMNADRLIPNYRLRQNHTTLLFKGFAYLHLEEDEFDKVATPRKSKNAKE
jgi:hypothetical protein